MAAILSGRAESQSLEHLLGPNAPKATPLDSPTFVTSWPGNSKILVVVERGSALVTWWDLDDLDRSPQTIIDLSSQAFIPSMPDFIGVSSVAFDPSFVGGKRHLYVRYNAAQSPQSLVETRIVRYTIKPGRVGVVPSSATTIHTIPTMHTAHGGGTIQFAPPTQGTPRTLYVPVGDDSDSASTNCDTKVRAQDPTMAPPGGPWDFGKVLAIDVEANPPIVTKIARGLRNPYFFSVDRGHSATGLGRGDLWIGDVGEQGTGAVYVMGGSNFVPGIPNFGWPWQETDPTQLWVDQVQNGALHRPATQPFTGCHGHPTWGEPTIPPTYTTPILNYSESDTNHHSALIGGYVYRTGVVASLKDRYVFAVLGAATGPRPHVYSISSTAPYMTPTGPDLHDTSLGLASWGLNYTIQGLGQDCDGELYVIRVDSGSGSTLDNGDIFKIVP